jgi:hypothetical protein
MGALRDATPIALVAALVAGGCIKGFQGANLEVDLSPGNPVQGPVNGMPAMGELPAAVHFSIYAIQGSAQTELTRFEVHHIVDLSSPCYIDVGEHVPHPGLHVSQFAKKIAEDTGIPDITNPPPTASQQAKEAAATAMVRMGAIAILTGPQGLVAVTSASPATYPAVASACGGPANEIPPPTCMDEASNQLRLQLCQAVWKSNPDLWEGTDRVLTEPLNGITHGMRLLPMNPLNGAPVGGAQFFVDNPLVNIEAYAIYFQADGVDTPGTQLYFGRPTAPTRGVQHVHMVSPINPMLTAEMSVFADLGSDSVNF